MKIKYYYILVCILLSATSFAQEIVVQGNVSTKDGPLPGASVVVKGSASGTQTDFDGNFSLKTDRNSILVFSYIGFITQETKATSSMNIILVEDAAQLEEVVVVAYGTASKSSFTGSVNQISAAEILDRPLTNVLTALDGAAPGVRITPANGQPGSSPSIRVRGVGSINASSSPLIIVDGVEFVGSFSSINPNDISSLSVLKDAASTSLYGSRAANGVILITTKKGKKGKDTFSLDVSQGVSSRSIKEYKRVNASEYYMLMWEALRNGFSISGTTPVTDANQMASDQIFDNLGVNPFNVPNDQIVLTDGAINPSAKLLYEDDLDWQDQLIRTGYRSNLNFSYSGGSDNTDYFASIGYLKEDGYIIKSDFERITGRLNVNSNLKEWFKTGINLSVATSTSNNAADGSSSSLVNPFGTSRQIAPIYPVFLHNPTTGAFLLDDAGNRIYDSSTARVGSSSGRNVIQETILNIDSDKIFSFNARTYGEVKFLQNFTFTFNAALDKRFFNTEGFDNPVVGDGSPDGRAERDAIVNTTVNYNQLLKFNKSFGDHTVGVLLGHENFETERNFLTGFRSGIIADGNTELINFTTTLDLESNTRRLTREGYFSNITYDYNDKYYLNVSARRDASSRFDKDARWGNFFAVGGSWRLDQENFMNGVDWLSTLKIRASYGEVGNDDIFRSNSSRSDFYASQALLSLGFNNGAEGGIISSAKGNPDLSWETNIQTDAAIEFGFLNNRISGTVEYYNRESEDLLFFVPLSVSEGLDDFPDNIGSMTNKGLEVDLNVGIFDTENFGWKLNINAATLNNEITELPQKEIIDGTKKLVVGGDIFAYWLRDWYGVDPTDGSGLYVLDTELGAIGDDDVRTASDGTAVTTNQNKALFDFGGTATPDLFGSFSNDLRYKNFELGFTFTYQIGGETYDSAYRRLLHSGQYGTALSNDILNRWQKPGDITDVPRLDVNQTSAFGAASDRWLVKSDYLALRQVNLAYNFNRELVNRLGVSGARLYMSGENLFLINKRQGLESSQNFNGTTSNRFTPSRIITVGFNVTF
ncbi:SusC/RagA family TonB-linked outer membrane protein [Aquimarina sediminis]|uniref:SusC/RagA family TonB-linked outer membrane protein n=1 Tax=Aquimarina sediminis TaxID=2070536 RepID=UPI000CA07CA8|nr:SusC/RagA family TonB-linked outer membrane protein [Aquimarina sediminis]